MERITSQQLKAKLDSDEDFVLLYVLSPEEFKKQRIKGSINIPINELKRRARIVLPEKDKQIALYSASSECSASPSACKTLEQLGYTNILDYEGGIQEWVEAGYPVESGPPRISEEF